MEAKKNIVFLSNGNMDKYGFARFYYPGEENITRHAWKRDILKPSMKNLTSMPGAIVVQETDLVPLSVNQPDKIINWDNFLVERKGQDINAMKILAERAGWNQTRNDLEFFIKLAGRSNFLAVAEIDKVRIPLGSGVVFRVGEKLRWIGMILVHPELRRQGIASFIMRKCVEDALFGMNPAILGLDATPMGTSVYETLGFVKTMRIWRCTLSTAEKIRESREFGIDHLQNKREVFSYIDRKGFGDRMPLYKVLPTIPGGLCIVARLGRSISGNLMSRPGMNRPFIGPVIADSQEAAINLIAYALLYWRKLKYEKVFIDIPEYFFHPGNRKLTAGLQEENPVKHLFLKKLAMVRSFDRMYQLVHKDHIDVLLQSTLLIRKGPSDHKKWEEVLHKAAENFRQTREYIEIEKERLLPFQYAIGGPEIS